MYEGTFRLRDNISIVLGTVIQNLKQWRLY